MGLENTELPSSVLGVSERIRSMIMENSELGSRLVSLLLVNSGNAAEIIESINKGGASNVRSKSKHKRNEVKPVVAGAQSDRDYTYKNTTEDARVSGDDDEDAVVTTSSQWDNRAITTTGGHSSANSEDEVEDNESLLLKALEKRRKNSEASARFRIRKKQRRMENLEKLAQLNSHIDDLNKKIDGLLQENRHWKSKLEEINEQKSKQLLEQIKKKNGILL
ncbi:uncharacterized protein CGFF_00103 [Nakaseomyces glabratus]|nr:Basic-leucine zipper (bZIP) domain signature [Nakaseomyces glabratus]QNG15768.1 MET28 [Nakaseomyces glabratus]SCV12546.1 uncharacterized protein CGFF_00103 [Nakaseomyces glabratus]SLM10123.1 uncharacterized protein CGFF_00103 [Nakaseomyces glabratus]